MLRQRKSDLERWKQGEVPRDDGMDGMDGAVVVEQDVPKSPVRMRGMGRLETVRE